MAFSSPTEKSNPYVRTSQYEPAPQALEADERSKALEILKEKDLTYKKRIRWFRFVTRCMSTILSGYMIGALSFSLAKYYLTRNHVIAGDVHPWATPTILWPTFMLLSIAIITFWLNVIILCTYVCSVKAANTTSSVAKYIAYAMTIGHFVVWAVSTGLFKMANDGTDLWGYSCGSLSDEIQPQVQSFLDFGKLCTLNDGAWYSSILEAVTYGLTFLTLIFSMRRMTHQKKLQRELGENV